MTRSLLVLALLLSTTASWAQGQFGAMIPVEPGSWVTPSAWETDSEKLCLPLEARVRLGEPIPQAALDDCRAEAASRLEVRRANAPTLSRTELDEIPEAYRIEEEWRRLEELDAPPPIAKAALRAAGSSAAYCTYADMASHLGPRTKDYARSMSTLAKTLASSHAALLPCTTPLVKKIRRCLTPGVACDPETARYLAWVPPVYP